MTDTLSAFNDLVTVRKARNEFEAGLIVALLNEHEIEAYSFGMSRNAFPLDTRFTGVPVQVRAEDLERARGVLREHEEAPAEIDWDEVDVGEREDRLPLGTPGRMPWPARMSLAVLILIVVATALAGLLVVIF